MEWLYLAIGMPIGIFSYWMVQQWRVAGFRRIAEQIVQRAELEAEVVKKDKQLEVNAWETERKRKIEEALIKEYKKIQTDTERLRIREEKIEERWSTVEKQIQALEKKEKSLTTQSEELKNIEATLVSTQKQSSLELEKISQMTRNEAREWLLEKVSKEIATDTAAMTSRAQEEASSEATRISSSIIATALNRLATPTVSEVAVTTLPLPNDEMKRRIVGRDGRNIRTLEHLTGVTLLLDDTPGVVVLSGFDPIRKEIAKIALYELMTDGRIHPQRIEEAVEKAQSTILEQIKKRGERAAHRAGIVDLHPELITLLGKLSFRFSFGQNVLEHSLEVSHIMGMMASELHLDVESAKRIGLLHDMGKAISHEMEGSHAIIGYELALKYGESELIANGIGCHHEEIEPSSPEAWLCCAADKLSASRPGARVEALEEYVKRVKKLETIALSFPEVEKAYAIQAGREVRVAVRPDCVDDEGLVNLSRTLAKKIEKELQFPGKIKVTAIREKRVVSYAI